MTPTLFGRWQTRLFLNAFFGIPTTLLYMLVWDQFAYKPTSELFWHMPNLLFYLTVTGLALDVVYILVQRLRWDRDWPPAFQLGGGALELGVVFGLLYLDVLPSVDWCDEDPVRFPIHYVSMWVPAFFFLFGPMRVLFPRWRFSGGKLIGGGS